MSSPVDEPPVDSSAKAPLIHISHPHVPERPASRESHDNPVFTLGSHDNLAERPAAGGPHPARPAGTGLPQVEVVDLPGMVKPAQSPGSPGLSRRRGSYHLQQSNSLTVPDTTAPRRHSLATPEDTPNHLSSTTSSGSMAHLSVTASNLLTPYIPGARSLSSTWSEIDRLERRRGSQESIMSHDSDRRMSGLSLAMSARLKSLARRFSERTERFKELTVQPPTPSTGGSVDSKSGLSGVSGDAGAKKEAPGANRLKALITATTQAEAEAATVKADVRYIGKGCCRVRIPKSCYKRPKFTAIDPQGRLYLFWLAFITFIYMYNGIGCTLRAAFRSAPYYVTPEELEEHRRKYMTAPVTSCIVANVTQNGTEVTSCFVNNTQLDIPPFPVRWRTGYETPENRMYWWIIDYMFDLVYIIDIIFVRSRIQFIRNGLFEKSIKLCAKNYRSKVEFKLDVLSLLPLDLLYLIPAVKYNSIVRLPRLLRYDVLSLLPLDVLYAIPQLNYCSLVRLPRILRIHICWEFFDRVDQAAKSGYIIRVIRTLTYMMFLIHVETCGYYAMSAYEGLNRNQWVYSGNGIAYVRCMYLATKTATSIGNNPKPVETVEFGFMTVYWLSGVFVFAMLIGQIRDIFQSATSAETTCRRSMDRAVGYMQNLNVPKELMDKVRSWFNYNWEHQKTLNENSLLDGLPIKMMTDLAIAVHFQTLSKVQLFQDCEKNLLYDLVLKLQPVLYLPKDYICKKGEVGTEMYIVKQGQVEVVGGDNDSIVFATLHEGSVFGEISLLGIQGGNRRTASVRSSGFSNLFLLTKDDFEVAMADYPDAHKLLKRRSMKVLAKNQKKVEESKKMEAEEIIRPPEETPKMVRTVISLLEPESKMYTMLRRASRRGSMFSQGPESATEGLRGDLDLLSTESDDEILIVETEERPLSPNSLRNLEGDLENRDAEEPAVTIKLESAKKHQEDDESDLTSVVSNPSKVTQKAVEEILQTPPKTPPKEIQVTSMKPKTPDNVNVTPTVGRNKVGPAPPPAEISMESDMSEKVSTPKKKPKKPKPGLHLIRSNKVDVERASDEIPKGNVNLAKTTEIIPPENQVTCDVEVHREKSPSITSTTNLCLDNEGFVADDEGIQVNEKNTETAV